MAGAANAKQLSQKKREPTGSWWLRWHKGSEGSGYPALWCSLEEASPRLTAGMWEGMPRKAQVLCSALLATMGPQTHPQGMATVLCHLRIQGGNASWWKRRK